MMNNFAAKVETREELLPIPGRTLCQYIIMEMNKNFPLENKMGFKIPVSFRNIGQRFVF